MPPGTGSGPYPAAYSSRVASHLASAQPSDHVEHVPRQLGAGVQRLNADQDAVRVEIKADHPVHRVRVAGVHAAPTADVPPRG